MNYVYTVAKRQTAGIPVLSTTHEFLFQPAPPQPPAVDSFSAADV